MLSSFLRTWREVAKYRVLVGAVFICLSLGVPFYYGNLASYSTSFYRYRLGPDASDIPSEWMLSIFIMALSIGIMFCRYMADKMGQRLAVIACCVVFDLGIFLTYFTVQVSVGLTLLTLMAMTGFCSGVNITLGQVYVKDWFPPKQTSMVVAIVSSAFGLGAIIFNQMTTSFINPENLSPDSFEANMVYFSQPEILDRFPLVFFPIGVVSAFLQIIGILLLKSPPGNTIKDKTESDNVETLDNGTLSGDSDKNVTLGTSTDGNGVVEEFSHNDPSKTISNNKGYQTMEMDSNRPHMADSKAAGIGLEKEHNTNEDKKIDDNFLTPSEAFRSRNFYLFWWTFFVLSIHYFITSNYYKKFGEVWIQDDQFLTIVGSTAIVFSTTSRILIALIVDRWGIRTTNVFLLAFLTCLMVFWYPCVRAEDKVFYLFFTNFLYGAGSVLFVLVPITALKMFGHKHFAIGYGQLSSSITVASLIAPPLLQFLASDVGWFWLFLVASGLSGIMMVVTAVFVTRV